MKADQTHAWLSQKLARPFIAGVIALFPLVFTIAVVVWLGRIIHDFLGPPGTVGKMLRGFGLTFVTSDVVAYLIGAVTALGLIYVLGVLVEAGMKSRWHAFSDQVLARVPLIGTIYDAAKKIAQMIGPRDKGELQSMTPVLCSFGGRSGTTIPAFMPTRETLQINGRDFCVVMIPTAPIPFGGAIMCVPIEWVRPMDCGIDGLFNIYMSMGVTMRDVLGEVDDAPADEKAEKNPD